MCDVDLSYRKFLKNLEKSIIKKNVQNALVESKFIEKIECKRNRPLYVVYYTSNLNAYQVRKILIFVVL